MGEQTIQRTPQEDKQGVRLPSAPSSKDEARLPKIQIPKREKSVHRLDAVRTCTDPKNTAPATEWNRNVHYYSNVPAETDGLFAHNANGITGVFDLGFAHNRALSKNIAQTGNYWEALRATANSGYRNGALTVSNSVSNPLSSAVSLFSAGKLSLKEIKVPFSGTQVYPVIPEAMDPKHDCYEKMHSALDPKKIRKTDAKVFQVHLISGYSRASEKSAWQDDSQQLDRAMQKYYGRLYVSEQYDPQRKDDTSFGAFAKYLYEKAESLPPGSVVIVSMFGHGNKSLQMIPSLDPKRSVEGAYVGTFAWGDQDSIPTFPSVERTNVNEWEMRQLLNSLPQSLHVIAHGHQCLGGQMSKGERVNSRFIAPSNRGN